LAQVVVVAGSCSACAFDSMKTLSCCIVLALGLASDSKIMSAVAANGDITLNEKAEQMRTEAPKDTPDSLAQSKETTAIKDDPPIIAGDEAATEQAASGENALEKEIRLSLNCKDTEGWTNGMTKLDDELMEHYKETEQNLEDETHSGVKLFIEGQGLTCEAYTVHGICVNPHVVSKEAVNLPCVLEGRMQGTDFNSPEEHCCGCGKSRVAERRTCSPATKAFMLGHRTEVEDAIFDGLGNGVSSTFLMLIAFLPTLW